MERVNAATHFFGASLAALGCVLLPLHALRHNADTSVVLGLFAFCVCLLSMMSASAIYHQLHHTTMAEKLQRLDHCAIFLLIAGTYTPFMIFTGTVTVLAIVWTLAIIGVVRSVLGAGTPGERAGLALVTGWMGVWSYQVVKEKISTGVMGAVFSGGMAYSLGIPFYLGGRRVPVLHVVWHVAVMMGGGLHFWALWQMVAETQ